MTTEPENLEELKAGLKATWSAGDYGLIARGLAESAEAFLADQGIGPGERVLDVACGSGQLALPAARAGARVTGLDITEAWIEQGRAQAEAEGLDIAFDVADAEDMPYPDASFDVTMSLIGAMFAPRPERVTAELLRVTRPGGRIVLGNWTPEGFVGGFFRTVARHMPPPDMPSPLLWGDETAVRERLAEGVSDLRLARRALRFRYPMPPEEVTLHYLAHFGPTKRAAEALDTNGRAALRNDLERHWAIHNDAIDGRTEVDAEILEVVATRA